MSTIGWTQERTDEVLVPVIRDMNRREHEGTQSNLTAFFSGSTGAGASAPRRRQDLTVTKAGKKTSRRMEGALGKMQEGAKRKRRSTGASGENKKRRNEDESSAAAQAQDGTSATDQEQDGENTQGSA